jgi:geranylgeranyl pyrophosphate synthase
VGKQSEEVVEKSRLFGEKVGVCFQMIDDNLDYTPTSGKDQDKDLKDGLINFTTLNLYENFPELYYTIFQIRGTNFQERPWTAEQANVAKKETIKEVDVILLDVKKLFIEIVALSKPTSSESCIQNMFNFLDQIRDRSR